MRQSPSNEYDTRKDEWLTVSVLDGQVPSLCLSENQDVMMSDLEPVTPKSKIFPETKTPQCLHVTPGMLGSPNR